MGKVPPRNATTFTTHQGCQDECVGVADVTDPNIVHQTMNKLDAAGTYQESAINGFVADCLANKGNNALTKWGPCFIYSLRGY